MTAPHDRPDAAELVEAVRAFLADEVLHSVDGKLRFKVRVAVNALGIVHRELDHGPLDERTHLANLASVGCASDAELADAIRSGRLEGRRDQVAAVVRSGVWAKVRVANPKYVGDHLPPHGPTTRS